MGIPYLRGDVWSVRRPYLSIHLGESGLVVTAASDFKTETGLTF